MPRSTTDPRLVIRHHKVFTNNAINIGNMIALSIFVSQSYCFVLLESSIHNRNLRKILSIELYKTLYYIVLSILEYHGTAVPTYRVLSIEDSMHTGRLSSIIKL